MLKMRASLFPSTLAFGIFLLTLSGHCYGQLKVGFYNGKCGENDVEQVIHEAVKQKITADPDTVSDLVRLSFHDCFVRVSPMYAM